MENKLTKFLKFFFLIGISLVFLVFMVLQLTHRDSFSPLNYHVTFLDQGASRILEDGSAVPITAQDSYYVYQEAQAGERITIAVRLPRIESYDMFISVFSSEQDIGVYIDGAERLYYSDKEDRLAGTYSASRFVTVPLQPEDSNKELRITYQTTVFDSAGRLACPMYGTLQDVLSWIFFRYLSQIMAAVLLMAVGFVFIVFGIVLKYNHRDNKGICYLGVFSIVMATWLICQSNMRVFYSSYLSGVNLMSIYMVMIAPIPLLMFFNILMKYRFQQHFNILIIISLVNVGISMAAEFADVADSINLLPVTHIVILVTCCVCLIDFSRYIKSGDIAEPRAVMIGLIGLFLVIIIEELNMAWLNLFYSGKYLGYGILFFLLNFGYASFRSSEEQDREYKEAVRSNQVKSIFLANMSHEIRTPISTIMGMDEMILSESNSREITQYAQNIRNAGNILLSLVNDILDFTKIEAGRVELIPARYELRDLLNDLVCSIGSRAEMKGLSLELDIEESIPDILYGDGLRIRQAVTNLLTNAVKYTRKGGVTLEIKYINLSDDEIRLYISVIDTGIGIRREDQKRLFESFVRLDENRNRSIEGTGLGLAITSHIVKLMNGNIELKSEYGKGSAFTISFTQKVLDRQPVGTFEDWYQNTVSEPKHYMEQYEASEVRLLIVDDNEMNLEVIKGLLKKTGAQIDAVTGGRECLEFLKKKEYDLILLDHMMPEMDGIETLRKIQESEPAGGKNLPVIALTANAVSGAREEYLRRGFADYIAKPVEYSKLIGILKKFLPDKIRQRSAIETSQVECEDYLERKGIHMEAALKYTAGDFDQYIHLLELFTMDKGQSKQALLQEAYENLDWKNYVTYVHGLKNCARMIGADELADMAYEHECRGKQHDKGYLRKNYSTLINKWNETTEIIAEYLDKHSTMQQGKKETTNKPKLQDGEWEESLERIAGYLDIFKKKEALGLLEGLERYELDSDKRQLLEETVNAVKGYDYEKAIELLRKQGQDAYVKG